MPSFRSFDRSFIWIGRRPAAGGVIPLVHLPDIFEHNRDQSGFILISSVTAKIIGELMQVVYSAIEVFKADRKQGRSAGAEPAQSLHSNSDPLSPDTAERGVIEATVAQVFGVDGSDLRRSTRGRANVARARQVAMYLAHVACGMSLTEVGRTFARDRTTVSHACGVIEDGRDDPTFDRVLELLEQVVSSLVALRHGRSNLPSVWLPQ